MDNKLILVFGVVIVGLAAVIFAFQPTPQAQPRIISQNPQSTLPPPPPTPSPIPRPVTSPQLPTSTPPPIPKQCHISGGNISTSTWKTFSDPNWEISFQYPRTWRLYNGKTAGGILLVSVSGDGQVDIRKDNDESLIPDDLGMNYLSCSRFIAGQSARTIEYYYLSPHPTLITGVQGGHTYTIGVSEQSSTEITDTILDTITLNKKI